MAAITLEKVTKVYPNGFEAVHELELNVADGEFMVLVGPSGCGKTTALRMVAGLEDITAGRVLIGDRVVNDVPEKDRDIAMVFQNYALYPNMTVAGNIGFALKLRKTPKEEIQKKVSEAVDLLGLTEWIDRKPGQLSGGQRQRVAMGRAIVREPSVFLMDEPLSNLDAKLRVQMRAEVARIQRHLGVATLYVTHDQVEAMTMGDRVAVLSAGTLQQVASPQELYDNPKNLFVAGFMGSPSMNLFKATLGGAANTLLIGDQRISLPDTIYSARPGLREYGSKSVVVGIRPEDLSLRETDNGSAGANSAVFEGDVHLVEALGSEVLLHFTSDAEPVEVSGTIGGDAEGLNEGAITRNTEGVARVEARTKISAGSRVRFHLDPARLYFFDPRTTDAIGIGESANGSRTGRRVREPASQSEDGGDGESHGDRGPGLNPGRDGSAAQPGATGPGMPLGPATLERADLPVPVPTYRRAAAAAGIVHIGVGGFHRAHQAMYIDRLLNEGGSLDWGICGVGLMPEDREMQRVLTAQDHLYTLVQKHSDGRYEPRIIGSIIDYMYGPDNPVAVVQRLVHPATEIVSLTITEGGYGIDESTGRFDPSTPGVAEDLRPNAIPRSVFGVITAALAERRTRGAQPFTVVSCDNLADNGSVAREAFVSFAGERDPPLADWIEREVCFPNSMVDRITPATTQADRDEITARFGITDQWPVVCEPFTQWVLEDSFSSRRPPLELAGVQLVSDVAPYELMKLRLLNASHQGLCYFARLCGYTYVHEAAQDPTFRDFLKRYMDDEATPSLDPVPGVDLATYKDTLIERFSNPEIRDTIARLCAESSDRIPKWLLPVIRYQLAHDGPVAASAAIVASWARYAEGIDEDGHPIDVVDRRREEVMARAAFQATDPTAFIANHELFGDLVKNQRFVDAYLVALRSLHQVGARKTVEWLAQART